jgi:hypothetical protein
MSVSKYLPHVLVLPEDRANRQLANGFRLYHSVSIRKIDVLREAGGWNRVLEIFLSDHVVEMDRYPDRWMILLIDFDSHKERLTKIKAGIPTYLTERVFILGALSKPEALRQAGLGTYEEIGLAMAKDCLEGTDTIWGHDLLRHNASELDRLREHVRPILF